MKPELHVFDVFDCHEEFVMSIGFVYALVMVVYFCKRNSQNYILNESEKDLVSYCLGP